VRLIDGDALIEQIEKNKCEPCKIRGRDRNGVCCRSCRYGDEMDDIYDAPTIEERKRGHWINDRLVTTNGGTYAVRRCPFCESYYQDVGYGWDYCPNCGARMGVKHATD